MLILQFVIQWIFLDYIYRYLHRTAFVIISLAFIWNQPTQLILNRIHALKHIIWVIFSLFSSFKKLELV